MNQELQKREKMMTVNNEDNIMGINKDQSEYTKFAVKNAEKALKLF